MSTSPLKGAAEDLSSAFSSFEPDSAADLVGLFGDLPQVAETLKQGLASLAGKAGDEFPLDPAVTDGLREATATLAGLEDHFRELNTIFRSRHHKEIERLEEPRTGEATWNVPA